MSDTPATICPICGGELIGTHCKLVCRNCGYREDCSDLFGFDPPPQQERGTTSDPPTYPPS